MPMPPKHDLTGRRFGNLVAIKYIHGTKKIKGKWLCRCDCGSERANATNDLLKSRVQSCGCTRYIAIGEKKRTHGHSAGGATTRTFRVWTNMKSRCFNPKASNFEFYGGRGITVCAAWRDSFQRFHDDMGDAPAGMWLDRIDSNGHYCKENCRWATPVEQQNNKRSNRLLDYKGRTLTLSELARQTGLKVSLIWARLERGASVDEAVEQPLRGSVACAHGNFVSCHACRVERSAARRRAKGIPELSPTACPKGHLFTPETTKLNNGWRACRVCAREYMRAYSDRKRAQRGVRFHEPATEEHA